MADGKRCVEEERVVCKSDFDHVDWEFLFPGSRKKNSNTALIYY